jgi:uncharacterized protein YtpQ (UPF0354 family)
MTQDELADRFQGALLELCPELKVTRTGADELFLELSGGGSSHAYLRSLAARLEGQDRPEVIEQFARASLEALRNSQASLSDIVPLIRDLDAYARTTAHRFDKSVDEVRRGIAHVPFAEPLYVVFGFDGVETMRTATSDEIAAFGLSPEALMDRALENLRRKLPQCQQHGDTSHLCLFTAGGNYEASLLLDRSVWEGELDRVQGTLLAFVPSRDVFLLVDSANTLAVAKALHLAKESYDESPYALAPTPLGWNGTRWERYTGELPEPEESPSHLDEGAPKTAAARRSGWLVGIIPYALMASGISWQGAVLTHIEPGLGVFGRLIFGAPVLLALHGFQTEPIGRPFSLHLLGLGLCLASLAACVMLVLIGTVPLGPWNYGRLLAVAGALAALYELRDALRARREVATSARTVES